MGNVGTRKRTYAGAELGHFEVGTDLKARIDGCTERRTKGVHGEERESDVKERQLHVRDGRNVCRVKERAKAQPRNEKVEGKGAARGRERELAGTNERAHAVL